jgi:hypothetical protein
MQKHLALLFKRIREFDGNSATYGCLGCGRGKCERCKEDLRVVAFAEGFGESKVELAR